MDISIKILRHICGFGTVLSTLLAVLVLDGLVYPGVWLCIIVPQMFGYLFGCVHIFELHIKEMESLDES